MMDVLRQPAEWRTVDWREKADIYRECARTVKDSALRRQFADLAQRHFEMAAAIGKNSIASAAVTPEWLVRA